ncbi:unnamed protein product, partial [Ectocarpus sp. 4 AP-2014]
SGEKAVAGRNEVDTAWNYQDDHPAEAPKERRFERCRPPSHGSDERGLVATKSTR